jgi:apoptosis-stimulating of p53 protein 2
VTAASRVAAVGPYIQSSTMPRMPSRPELLVKPALPDGSFVMQASEGPMKIQTLPNMRSGAALQSKGKNEFFPSPSPLSSSPPQYIFPQV